MGNRYEGLDLNDLAVRALGIIAVMKETFDAKGREDTEGLGYFWDGLVSNCEELAHLVNEIEDYPSEADIAFRNEVEKEVKIMEAAAKIADANSAQKVLKNLKIRHELFIESQQSLLKAYYEDFEKLDKAIGKGETKETTDQDATNVAA